MCESISNHRRACTVHGGGFHQHLSNHESPDFAAGADLSGLAMTDKEKEEKSDLLRDREALRYAEFFCGDRCYTTSDHARTSPYHSSRIERAKADKVERGQDDGVHRSRVPSPHKIATGAPSHPTRPTVVEAGQGISRSGLTTSHMWPLLKLVQTGKSPSASIPKRSQLSRAHMHMLPADSFDES